MELQPFQHDISSILNCRRFAVAGASDNPEKYGNKVYRALKARGYEVFAVNPTAESVDGDEVFPLLDNVPGKIDVVVAVTQPEVTYEIVRRAGHLRIPFLWMQPGAESESAIIELRSQGLVGVFGGPCILVALATHGRPQWMLDEEDETDITASEL